MIRLKKWVFFTSIIVFLVNFPLHFLYEFFPSFLTSIISPVNESVFEHMKMIFSSFIIGGIICYFIFKKKDLSRYMFSFSLIGIFDIALFLIIYIPINLIFKENMILTFIILYFSILVSQILCYYILFFSKIKYQNLIFIGILLIFYSVCTYFTYNPLNLEFFHDVKNDCFGIKC